MRLVYILICFFVLYATLQSQTFLRVSALRFGHVKVYEVYTGEMLSYKLKGDLLYRKNRIMAMQDSNIVFANDEEITLKQLKALRLNKHVHLVGTVQTVFFFGAFGFVTLNTLNNVIINTTPVFNPAALYISAGLAATGFLIRELNIKRIRINRNKDLKILSLDFEHLNGDTTHVSR